MLRLAQSQIAKSLFAFVFLPNILFLLVGIKYYIMRPLINVDYFILAFLIPVLPRIIVFTLFTLIFSNDLIVNLAPIYHFSISDVFLSAKDLFYLSPGFIIPVL